MILQVAVGAAILSTAGIGLAQRAISQAASTDYLGISALIVAITGLVAAVGSFVISVLKLFLNRKDRNNDD